MMLATPLYAMKDMVKGRLTVTEDSCSKIRKPTLYIIDNNLYNKLRCSILFSSFPLLFAFVVGGLGFEFCVFVASWRHALRSEWPFIIKDTTQTITP